MPVNVLFCSDALIVDGVTSFVFHLSTALSKGGFNVAVLGRWAGKGFQSRLREHGVRVIQCLSPTVGNVWFDRKAREFAPDVIVTDSRRSFPLATRLKTVTGAKVLTFFLDSLEKTDRRGRDVDSLIRYSDAWLSAEPPLLEELDRIKALGLIEKGEIKQFHILISNAIRRYILDLYGIEAPDMTTWELCEALRPERILGEAKAGEFQEFLEACDLVKFAKYKPPV
jgi:hypothetical protein